VLFEQSIQVGDGEILGGRLGHEHRVLPLWVLPLWVLPLWLDPFGIVGTAWRFAVVIMAVSLGIGRHLASLRERLATAYG
jgi:hypothetical protein